MTKLWIVNGTLAGKDEQYTLSYSWLADMFWGVCLFACLFFKIHSDRRNGDIGKTSNTQLKQQEKSKAFTFFLFLFYFWILLLPSWIPENYFSISTLTTNFSRCASG